MKNTNKMRAIATTADIINDLIDNAFATKKYADQEIESYKDRMSEESDNEYWTKCIENFELKKECIDKVIEHLNNYKF